MSIVTMISFGSVPNEYWDKSLSKIKMNNFNRIEISVYS